MNGELIEEIRTLPNGEKIIENDTCYMKTNDIKSIVTKEKFEAMKYIVGE